MGRRQAREIALQSLFQLDLNPADSREQEEQQETLSIDTALGEANGVRKQDIAFIRSLVYGTREHLEAIDRQIAQCSRDWKISRMATVDRNIVRMAVFEIFFADEKQTPKIAINEAVELAKKFGTEDSSRYVNGILGAMVKHNT